MYFTKQQRQLTFIGSKYSLTRDKPTPHSRFNEQNRKPIAIRRNYSLPYSVTKGTSKKLASARVQAGIKRDGADRRASCVHYYLLPLGAPNGGAAESARVAGISLAPEDALRLWTEPHCCS